VFLEGRKTLKLMKELKELGKRIERIRERIKELKKQIKIIDSEKIIEIFGDEPPDEVA